mmetsp:Transcript_49933/g.100521  ORF Transcript_49933/g.100521 Transcript_49933/m.100521 type:complete len:101 (+) Transcript_49933:195-497(+)
MRRNLPIVFFVEWGATSSSELLSPSASMLKCSKPGKLLQDKVVQVESEALLNAMSFMEKDTISAAVSSGATGTGDSMAATRSLRLASLHHQSAGKLLQMA